MRKQEIEDLYHNCVSKALSFVLWIFEKYEIMVFKEDCVIGYDLI
jgi:hypothetical protein